MESQSFTARRSAASNLPTFQLPPPSSNMDMHKYPSYAATSSTQPVPPVSSVLTPPASLPSDNSPLSSLNSGSSQSSATGVPPYQPTMGFWPTPNNPSYAYSSAPSMPAPFAQQQQPQQQNYMGGRPLYSPPMNFQNRGTSSPTAGEGLPPPPYDISLPPFPTSMSSSGGQQHNLPNLAPQQQQPHLSNGQPSTQAPQQNSIHAADNYTPRQPPTPTYYTPASTPQQASFPAYTTQHSPTQHAPNSSSAPSSRISPTTASQPYHPRPFTGYNLPAMGGPIMSNVHNPGNQMALVGGMNMQYPQHQMNGMYGHPQQQAQNDRPFKCDQCPQSFNRNHDLKRHKRIHLAVKPFPCGHCEKSFSRKDALKRHVLVKNCGKSSTNDSSKSNEGSQSPPDRGDAMSDSADESPKLLKKDI